MRNRSKNVDLFFNSRGYIIRMPENLQVGSLGEDLVCHNLKSRGWTILARNVRSQFGEIDIITKHPNQTLVFVEVKTLQDKIWLSPEDNATQAKLRKLRRTCLFFANKNPQLINSRGWRIDLLAVILTGYNENCIVRHYENI
jgi:putative endonuclease